MERKYLSWEDVCYLIDRIVPQVSGHFDALVAITRGGIVPGGLLSERLRIRQVFIASVRFFRDEDQALDWPIFLQFPEDNLLHGKRILVVDDIWVDGVTITSVGERITQAGGEAVTLVLHYRPVSAPPGPAPLGQAEVPQLGAAEPGRPGEQAGLITPARGPRPDIIGEQTEDYIVYPWEAEHSSLGV
jgi:hypoxanthine phosphoribosyltransferase